MKKSMISFLAVLALGIYAADSPVQRVLSRFFGTGTGAGIAVMFFLVGLIGMVICLTRLCKPVYRDLGRPGK